MDTKLGDVLLAGLAKDPESVGRIVAQAIDQAATPIAAANPPEAEPEPEAEGEPKPETKSKRPSGSMPPDEP
jgi:hypothetical protein